MISYLEENDIAVVNDLLFKNFQINIEVTPFSRCLVYKENGIIKGVLSFSEIYDRLEIDYIFVKTEYRKIGVASKLLTYLLDFCNSKKIKNISLEVRISNEEAIALYKKFGFKIITIRKNYYNNEDGYLMVREEV